MPQYKNTGICRRDPIASDRGFTLIETVMVIVVLGIIGTGLLLYFAGIGSSGKQVYLTQAAALAEEKMEKIMADKNANGFSSIALAYPALATDPPFSAPFNVFTRQTEVFCVNESDLNTSNGDTTSDCPNSDITAKRVRVIITWAGGSADFITVISDH